EEVPDAPAHHRRLPRALAGLQRQPLLTGERLEHLRLPRVGLDVEDLAHERHRLSPPPAQVRHRELARVQGFTASASSCSSVGPTSTCTLSTNFPRWRPISSSAFVLSQNLSSWST